MALEFGPITYATAEQVEAYIGPTRAAALPADADEVTRLIARASELIYNASGRMATRAWEGVLLAGGYVDPLTPAAPLTQADYREGLANAVSAQVEFWLEWGEDHAIVGLVGSAVSGKVNVSQLPGQVAPRAMNHLSTIGILGSRVSIS